MPYGFGSSAERAVLTSPAPGAIRPVDCTSLLGLSYGASLLFSNELRRKGPKADPKAAATLKRLMDRYTQVQLATLVDQAPQGQQWIHEIFRWLPAARVCHRPRGVLANA
jgi:hypothetical protein